MTAIHAFALFMAVASIAGAAESTKAIEAENNKDKVSLNLDQEVYVQFKRDGNKLRELTIIKPADNRPRHVHVKLGTTSASPIPPPREEALRPYLEVTNNLEGPLRFRVLARNKDEKKFYEITKEFQPIPAGESTIKCWDFSSTIEEVVLYEFEHSEKPYQGN